MSAGKTKILLFSGALILFVLLFIAPRTKPEGGSAGKAAGEEQRGAGIAGMEVFETMALKSLDPEKKTAFSHFAEEGDYDTLVRLWLELKRPDLAALMAEKKAIKSGEAADFFAAGNRYYNSVQFISDNSAIPVLYQGAIRSFSEGLEKDPGNIDAKIMLASSYVEGSSEPMEGIRLLREAESIDSNNVKLQLSFAFFSVKSGQLDKALDRFRKVLAVDSNYIEAYLHMADVYERQGKTEETVRMLEKYAARTDNITARLEVNRYIEQLKSKLNN